MKKLKVVWVNLGYLVFVVVWYLMIGHFGRRGVFEYVSEGLMHLVILLPVVSILPFNILYLIRITMRRDTSNNCGSKLLTRIVLYLIVVGNSMISVGGLFFYVFLVRGR